MQSQEAFPLEGITCFSDIISFNLQALYKSNHPWLVSLFLSSEAHPITICGVSKFIKRRFPTKCKATQPVAGSERRFPFLLQSKSFFGGIMPHAIT